MTIKIKDFIGEQKNFKMSPLTYFTKKKESSTVDVEVTVSWKLEFIESHRLLVIDIDWPFKFKKFTNCQNLNSERNSWKIRRKNH